MMVHGQIHLFQLRTYLDIGCFTYTTFRWEVVCNKGPACLLLLHKHDCTLEPSYIYIYIKPRGLIPIKDKTYITLFDSLSVCGATCTLLSTLFRIQIFNTQPYKTLYSVSFQLKVSIPLIFHPFHKLVCI